MLKKVTALFFLTFASMIMLAFAVLPHHHHDAYVCFAAPHGEQEAPAEPHSHSEESGDASHGCVKKLFQTKVSRIQSAVHNCDSGHCYHFIRTFFSSPEILTFLSQEAEQKTFLPGYYREKLHPGHYKDVVTGRAPPRN